VHVWRQARRLRVGKGWGGGQEGKKGGEVTLGYKALKCFLGGYQRKVSTQQRDSGDHWVGCVVFNIFFTPLRLRMFRIQIAQSLRDPGFGLLGAGE